MILEGIIRKNDVLGDDDKVYKMPLRGTENGYNEVLMDARAVGGDGFFRRQSVAPYIGMRVEFVVSEKGYGYNYTIIKETK